MQVPGANAPSHYFWLFPIVVPRPDAVVNYMNARVSSPKSEMELHVAPTSG